MELPCQVAPGPLAPPRVEYTLVIHRERREYIKRLCVWRTTRSSLRFEVPIARFLDYLYNDSDLQCIYLGISQFSGQAEGDIKSVEFWQGGRLLRHTTQAEVLK